MAKNKWTEKLQKLEGSVVSDYNPFSHIIQSPSPSVNFCFGNSHGLPLGYSMVLWGPPKAGKSVLCNGFIGQLHQDDPDALVVKFNTEFRERGQMKDRDLKNFGIDKDRYIAYEVNAPAMVFDRIQTDINAMCQDGAPVKLIIVDSITGIQGRREMDSESIDKQQIGDHALTIQTGLKRILPVIRQHNIALILTAHARAELDMWEQKRGHKTKMQASFGVQHVCEYFMMVEKNATATGKKDMRDRPFINQAIQDIKGDGEMTGHKVQVWMQDSSMGPKDRSGEFTIDYTRGIINTYEEVFLLGTKCGIVERPNNVTYKYGSHEWRGKEAFWNALENDTEMQNSIIKRLKEIDLEGRIPTDETTSAEPGPKEA
jgi:hypothetical protein